MGRRRRINYRDKGPKPPMDALTAIAFAREAFELRHPERPADFWRYTGTTGRGPDRDGNFEIGFCWQRKDSNHGADGFFEVRVRGWNAATTVLLDAFPADSNPDDHELYDP